MTKAADTFFRRAHMRYRLVWRRPQAETEDYPGLFVHDGRVTGSITLGRSRLPVWAVIHSVVTQGWDLVEEDWEVLGTNGWTAADMSKFLYSLMEQRGEFGRLVCVLADVERTGSWWQSKRKRARLRAQLKRCLTALDACEPTPPTVRLP